MPEAEVSEVQRGTTVDQAEQAAFVVEYRDRSETGTESFPGAEGSGFSALIIDCGLTLSHQ